MADGQNINPTLRDSHNYSDRAGRKIIHGGKKLRTVIDTHAPESFKQRQEKQQDKQPAGGYDATPVVEKPAGYTVRITFHGARDLPFADLIGLSADPYQTATVRTDLPKRHKQDPDLIIRTPTIRKNLNPDWNSSWEIAHIPATGFTLKIRLYDEDPADHDDRLGNVTVHVGGLNESWKTIDHQSYEVSKRMASKRAYLIRGIAALLSRDVKLDAHLILSIECLGRSEGDGGRAYTIGPLPWVRHYSPLIGRLTGTKDRGQSPNGKKQTQRYNFQAIQMQLAGPVPSDLYHRYVEFKPFIAGMFTGRTVGGFILNRALHHQHNRIYNCDRSTLYGHFNETSTALTKQFLDFVHYDDGGRIFTYVLSLDALFRFTETGKEFGIDMLSKHTMHSDASIYIACSGEFFIRRLKKPWHSRQKSHEKNGSDASSSNPQAHQRGSSDKNSTNPPSPNKLLPETVSVPPSTASSTASSQTPSHDPAHYELIIDNDSGTYRPNAALLPQLREFMTTALPGLKIKTLDCQADAEKMKRLKDEQREQKGRSKGALVYMQPNNLSGSSISSSDESDLDSLEQRNRKSEKLGRIQSAKRRARLTKMGVKGVVEKSKSLPSAESGEGGLDGADPYRGRGGIVGQDGPVRMKEKKQKIREEKETIKEGKRKVLHPHKAREEEKEKESGSGGVVGTESVEKSDGVRTDEKRQPNGVVT